MIYILFDHLLFGCIFYSFSFMIVYFPIYWCYILGTSVSNTTQTRWANNHHHEIERLGRSPGRKEWNNKVKRIKIYILDETDKCNGMTRKFHWPEWDRVGRHTRKSKNQQEVTLAVTLVDAGAQTHNLCGPWLLLSYFRSFVRFAFGFVVYHFSPLPCVIVASYLALRFICVVICLPKYAIVP